MTGWDFTIRAVRFNKDYLPTNTRIIEQIEEWDKQDIPYGFYRCSIPSRIFFVDTEAALEFRKIDVLVLINKGCYMGNVYGIPILLEEDFR